VNYPAVVTSVEKDRVVIECARGPVLEGVFVRGKMPRVGNKGIAVVEPGAVKFRGPKGAGYFRVTGTR